MQTVTTLQSVRSITTGYTQLPKSKHDPYRTPPKNYVQLLQHITRARDIKRLDRLVYEYGPKFDGVHVAAAFSVLPQLAKPPRPGAQLSRYKTKQRKEVPAQLLARLQELAAAQVPRMFPREVASITWALGRCRRLLPGQSGHNPTTQQLVSSLLNRISKDSNNRMLYQAASGAEAAKLLHGLARLKLGKPLKQRVNALCTFIQRQPQRMHAKELAGAAWALAKIDIRSPAAVAALKTISTAAVERRLYLRPVSICSLATAWAHLRRKHDRQLLAVLAEESLAQIKDFKVPQLAVLCWALGRLDYNPGPELLAAIAAESRKQLEHFNALHLGLVLKGLRQLGGLDKQLLADVAAGIRKETAVTLNSHDAVRILAAFVALPDAGTASDVDAMAQRVGDALQKQAASVPVKDIANLLVIYSKLPAQHPVLLRLVEEAAIQAEQFSMDQMVKILQACQRLGFADPAYRDARIDALYRAANQHLRRHLVYAGLPPALAAADGQPAVSSSNRPQLDQKPKEKLSLWQRLLPGGGQHEEQEQDEEPWQLQHTLQFKAAVDVAKLVGDRGMLDEASAELLADVAQKLLPSISVRQLMMLLRAVSSVDNFSTNEEIRGLMTKAADILAQTDMEQQSLTVLAGLARPLGRAVSKGMLYTQGENVLRRWYAALLPRLEQLQEQQLLAVVDCMQRTDFEDESLLAAAQDIAARRGWSLPKDAWQYVLS